MSQPMRMTRPFVIGASNLRKNIRSWKQTESAPVRSEIIPSNGFMELFNNPFYSDEDCMMVHKTLDGWSLELFKREILNRSKKAVRTPFQRNLDNLTFCGAFRRLQGKTQVRQVGPECFSRT